MRYCNFLFFLSVLFTQAQNYSGGTGDGYGFIAYNQTQSIFNGGAADGFSVLNYTETQSIFNGGAADGFSVSNYTETQSIFNGGVADGFSVSNYTETQSIFNGGVADGFSVSNYTETQSIFNGGAADGFSMGLYNVNPLCSNSVTIWNGESWSNGIPDPTTQVIINGSYETQINGDLNACFTKIEQTSDFIISSNTYARVVTDFINNGLTDVQHQGSFVQVNENAISGGNGIFRVNLQTTQLDDSVRFTYFSSPLNNQSLEVFNSWANMNRLWRFNESIQDWYIINQTDIMIPGVGYAIQGNQDTGQYPFIGTAIFNNGVFNSGMITYPLTYNPGGLDNDNALVGNPYPCAIDAARLLNDNPEANAFYFWTHTSPLLPDGSAYAGDDYAIWNNSGGIASSSGSPAPSGYIASGQGFFVDAIATGNFTFKNAHRVTSNNNDFRIPNINDSKLWLNLTGRQVGFSQILISFSNSGTIGFDVKYDAVKLRSGSLIQLYSKGQNGEHFGIETRSPLNESQIIPIGIESLSIQNFTFSIDYLQNFENTTIYLKDNLLQRIHNLKNSDYTFIISETGSIENRFELIFRNEALSNGEVELNSQNLIISKYSDKEIKIEFSNKKEIKSIQIYNVLGKKILSKPEINKKFLIVNVNTKQGAVLIITVKDITGKKYHKKILKI